MGGVGAIGKGWLFDTSEQTNKGRTSNVFKIQIHELYTPFWNPLIRTLFFAQCP